jgi:hypothetical protein
MRRVLVLFVILAVLAASSAALWIFCGRQISSFLDRYWTVETDWTPIHSIAYEGSGTGGILFVNDLSLSLNELSSSESLSVGSTKDNQLAVAGGGKVFGFGPLKSTAQDTGERLTTVPLAGDQAFLVTRHSAISWPTPFDLNFMTGQSPSWKRHVYYQVRWKKSSGAHMELLWRYEQFFYPRNGWGNGFMTRQGSTGLMRVEIKE